MLKVTALWDDEASVWVAESDDVPGLATEAETMQKLVDKLRVVVPMLLEANDGQDEAPHDIPFELLARCTVIAHSTAN